MPTQLYVCNACCCGVERKGNMAVPLEELKEAWAEHGLAPGDRVGGPLYPELWRREPVAV